MSVAKTFFKSIAYLLIQLAVYFTEQKYLVLMKSSLSVISFMDHVSGVVCKMS